VRIPRIDRFGRAGIFAGSCRCLEQQTETMKGLGSAVAAVLVLGPACASAQVLTNTSNGTLTAVVSFTVNPGTSNNPVSNQVQFRIRSNNAAGYNITASTTYTTTPSAPDDGGRPIAASDIGVGITSLVLRSNVITPRTDVIAAGFDYDPSAVTAVNGLTPYTGMTGGQATVADLVNNPNIKILNGPQIHATNQNVTGTQNYITVTMTFALLPQYFTPGTIIAVITLTMGNGQ
jgi:hypothetical protein